jgi:hypothetical protein
LRTRPWASARWSIGIGSLLAIRVANPFPHLVRRGLPREVARGLKLPEVRRAKGSTPLFVTAKNSPAARRADVGQHRSKGSYAFGLGANPHAMAGCGLPIKATSGLRTPNPRSDKPLTFNGEALRIESRPRAGSAEGAPRRGVVLTCAHGAVAPC